jgi:hypothetical protein
MMLTWAPELTLFYNNAYAPFLGLKHPRALGRPFSEVWSDATFSSEGETVAGEQRIAETLSERRLFADAFQTTDTFIQILDPSYTFLAINDASAEEYKRSFGFRPVVGDNLLELLAGCPEQRAVVQTLWKRALAGEAFSETAELGDPAHDPLVRHEVQPPAGSHGRTDRGKPFRL